jgi:GxxExxY protein
MQKDKDPLTHEIIGAAMEVHSELGPGLLEAPYEEFLCLELVLRGLESQRQVSIPAFYKGRKTDVGFKADVIVNDKVILELKCVDKLLPVHHAQILSYMKLAHKRVGLLINFKTERLIDGIKRFVL